MSSNVFVTPRSITTIARGRIDHNTSLQALLQNFASNAQPLAESVNLEGSIGLQTGMLWYKAGNQPERGDGRLLVYDGATFTRTGIAVHRMSNIASANSAAASGFISRGDLVDVGDNRLYMVNSSGTALFDVGSLSASANTDASSLSGVTLTELRNEYRANDGVTIGVARANDYTTYITLQSEYKANDGVTLNAARANDGATLLSARANDLATYNTLRSEYRANDGATLLSASANDYNTYTTLVGMINDISGNAGPSAYQANDYNTYITLRSEYRANDLATYTTLLAGYRANDGVTLNLARANDYNTYTTLQAEYRANDGVTLNLARANDYNTYTTLLAGYSSNDGSTLATARANDYNTYTTLLAGYSSNDGSTLATARANDGATLLSARANDYSTYTTLLAGYSSNDGTTLLSARANDYATWSGLNSFVNLKANTASPTFTGTLTIPDLIVHSGDTDTSFGFSSTDEFSISTAGSERLTVTSVGRVDIQSASGALNMYSTGSPSAPLIQFFGNGNSTTALSSINPTSVSTLNLDSDPSNSFSSSTVNLRVDGSTKFSANPIANLSLVDLLVGKAAVGYNTVGAQIETIGVLSAARNGVTGVFNRTASDGSAVEFMRAGTVVGTISVTTTATAYNTGSDYRLKDDLRPADSSIVENIKIYNFRFKGSDSRMDGVLAHELKDLVPYAVMGGKDEMDELGNPVIQQVDYSKLVPLLISSLQTALADIKDLKNKISVLEQLIPNNP